MTDRSLRTRALRLEERSTRSLVVAMYLLDDTEENVELAMAMGAELEKRADNGDAGAIEFLKVFDEVTQHDDRN